MGSLGFLLVKQNIVLRTGSQTPSYTVHVGANVVARNLGCTVSGRKHTSQDGSNRRKLFTNLENL